VNVELLSPKVYPEDAVSRMLAVVLVCPVVTPALLLEVNV
jgi:hypothetical protein